jgi:predicted RecB family nuclease
MGYSKQYVLKVAQHPLPPVMHYHVYEQDRFVYSRLAKRYCCKVRKLLQSNCRLHPEIKRQTSHTPTADSAFNRFQ